MPIRLPVRLTGRALAEESDSNTEGEGFEPPKACTLVVFKAAASARSMLERRIKDLGQGMLETLKRIEAHLESVAAP